MKLELVARLAHTKVCFFDCDGVIFDSNRFKVLAMLEVLGSHSEAARAQMQSYWQNHGGMSRHAKFEYFFRHIAEVDDVELATEAAVLEFGRYSREGYRAVEPLPEALQLAGHVGRERAVVVSGAEQAELRHVFQQKQLTSLFSDVLGSPTKKVDLVRGVLDQRQLSGADALLIGDGAKDFEVCQNLGIHFVYLARYSEWEGARGALARPEQSSAGVTWADDWPVLLSLFGL